MTKADSIQKYGGYALLAGAFFIPINVGAAQIFLYLAVALWVVWLFLARDVSALKNPATIWLLAFCGLAIASVFYGEDTERSLKKIHRLILLGLVFAIPGFMKQQPVRLRQLVFALICGASILAVYDIFRIPGTWWYDVQHIDQSQMQGRSLPEHKMFLLYDKGNMRDPQFFTFVTLALFAFYPVYQAAHRKPLLCLMAVNFLALVLHNKRGAWLSFACALGVGILLSRTSLRFLKTKKGMATAAITVLLFGSFAYQRLSDLKDQFDPNHGGRLELWTKVFKPFMADHPWGIGYRALEHEDLKEYTESLSFTVKNHFHNNGLQIAAELGWLGLGIWFIWMMVQLAMLFRARSSVESASALACFLGLLALLLNGLVEYNFGDSEPFMLFVVVMGCTVWLWSIARRRALG